MSATAFPKDAGTGAPLLEWKFFLAPNAERDIDITQQLLSLFNEVNPARQEKDVVLVLSLDPREPATETYHAVYEAGSLLLFNKAV